MALTIPFAVSPITGVSNPDESCCSRPQSCSKLVQLGASFRASFQTPLNFDSAIGSGRSLMSSANRTGHVGKDADSMSGVELSRVECRW